MASTHTFRFDGMQELMEQLRQLPDELKEEASRIVWYQAQNAAGAIRASYPRVTGHLQDGVAVELTDSGKYGVRAVVVNKARHAYIWEFGTEARHSTTHDNLGRMPAGNVFVPTAMRYRDRMMDELVQLLVRRHLEVTAA